MSANDTSFLGKSNRKRALVIEDERKTFEGWVQELHDRGIDADVAVNPDEAIEKLNRNTYVVIILDLMMPLGSNKSLNEAASRYDVGAEILTSIRKGDFMKTGTSADVPVLVVTAVTEDSVLERIRSLNVEHIYTKPESPRVLAEHVKILIEQNSRL